MNETKLFMEGKYPLLPSARPKAQETIKESETVKEVETVLEADIVTEVEANLFCKCTGKCRTKRCICKKNGGLCSIRCICNDCDNMSLD